MARLYIDEIMSMRALLLVKYPDSAEAIDEYAGRMLQMISDKHEKDADWNARQVDRLDKEISKLTGE